MAEPRLRCVGRELGLPRNVYPKWVASGRLKQADADREIAAMESVLVTLMRLKKKSSQLPTQDRLNG
jgi:hypothetical protein